MKYPEGIKKETGGKNLLNKLSYPDSNQDKQNQNLLCYHYTIRQLPYTLNGPANILKLSELFGNEQIVVLFSALKNYVSAVNQIRLGNYAGMVVCLFLVD